MKTLHYNLKKKWFDMILSGEKKEEYREIKPHWISRLLPKDYLKYSPAKNITPEFLLTDYNGAAAFYSLKQDFESIVFRNGYSSDAREMTVELLALDIDTGKEEWGAVPGKQYFTHRLGKVISTRNIKP